MEDFEILNFVFILIQNKNKCKMFHYMELLFFCPALLPQSWGAGSLAALGALPKPWITKLAGVQAGFWLFQNLLGRQASVSNLWDKLMCPQAALISRLIYNWCLGVFFPVLPLPLSWSSDPYHLYTDRSLTWAGCLRGLGQWRNCAVEDMSCFGRKRSSCWQFLA